MFLNEYKRGPSILVHSQAEVTGKYSTNQGSSFSAYEKGVVGRCIHLAQIRGWCAFQAQLCIDGNMTTIRWHRSHTGRTWKTQAQRVLWCFIAGARSLAVASAIVRKYDALLYAAVGAVLETIAIESSTHLYQKTSEQHIFRFKNRAWKHKGYISIIGKLNLIICISSTYRNV